MAGIKRSKSPGIRKILLLAAWLVMLLSAAYYLYEYSDFVVDDTKFANEIREAAAKHGIDSRLVRALIYEESRFRPGAVGKAGEVGLMQIMPKRAAADWAKANNVPCPEPGVLFSPRINLEIGCWYLSDGLRRFKDYKSAVELALARYNAGLSRANKWKPADKQGAVIDNITIASTRKYVKNIMERYRRYCRESENRKN
ncbi:MAG: lytic transglycosylase domain-containing protein [Lentisphaeria bacterium]|nr:lytic transglycosylase domain-containing protein [Lentisphaeria bacterium]